MVSEQKHIIKKLVVEVNTNSKAVAFKLKDKLDVLLKDDILPFVEDYIDGVSSSFGNNIVQIPKIEIELKASASENFNELKSELKTAIEKKISSLIAKSSTQDKEEVRILTKAEYHNNSFINFLKTGTVSWLDLTDQHQFEIKHLKPMVSAKRFKQQFIKVLEDQQAQIRLINQFSDDQIQYLLNSAFPPIARAEDSKTSQLTTKLFSADFIKQIKSANSESRKILWQLIVNYLLLDHGKNASTISGYIAQYTEELKSSSQDKRFQSSLQNLLNASNISIDHFNESDDKTEQKRVSDKIDKKHTSELIDDELILNSSELEEGIIVENAGLILLHPYLLQFFKTCSLVDKKDELIDKQMAAHILHYLATKQENQYENHMVFEKLICGISPGKSVNRHVKLSKEIKHESEELLTAVIKNWGALKNASPDLLRHEFLMRSGKIMLKKDTLKLIIERKTQDILIDKLPWGISYCKLPWLKQLITTDW